MSKIHQALASVYQAVGYVQKTGQVNAPGAKYKYAGEADLIAALRPAMVAHGIMFYPAKVTITPQSSFFVNDKGQNVSDIIAVYTFRFVHVESGESIDVDAVGQGRDTGDKAAYKAATGAMKYALRQTFLIETGDDPDDTASEGHKVKKVGKLLDANDREDANSMFADQVIKRIKSCVTHEDVKAILQENTKHLDRIAEYSPGVYNFIDEALEEKRMEINAR